MFCSAKREQGHVAEVNINKHLALPLPLHIVLIHRSASAQAGDMSFLSRSTASSVRLNRECLGFGANPRADPRLCHGNLWTLSSTQPKTIHYIQTNIIPTLSFLFSSCRPFAPCTLSLPSDSSLLSLIFLLSLSLFFLFMCTLNVRPYPPHLFHSSPFFGPSSASFINEWWWFTSLADAFLCAIWKNPFTLVWLRHRVSCRLCQVSHRLRLDLQTETCMHMPASPTVNARIKSLHSLDFSFKSGNSNFVEKVFAVFNTV